MYVTKALCMLSRFLNFVIAYTAFIAVNCYTSIPVLCTMHIVTGLVALSLLLNVSTYFAFIDKSTLVDKAWLSL